MTSLSTTDPRCRGGNLIICSLVWLAMASACLCGSSTDTKVVGSNPLETGFHVSPSQISIQWATFRPFLSSPQGNFCLGFQEINMMDSNMDHGYVLSIMYTIRDSNNHNDSLGSATGDTNSTTFEEEPFNMEMVWSANLDIPVSANSTFSIDEEGYMALIDSDSYGSNKATVWSPTTKSGANTSSSGVILGQSLRLEENGNLVFSSLHNNDTIAWQSFEHPTDTILPGQNFTASMALSASLLASATTVPFINVTFNLKMESDGMALYVTGIGRNASDETMYWKHAADQATSLIDPSQGPIYARIERPGYLAMYQTEGSRVSFDVFNTYNSTDVNRRRMKLDNDGNIRVYYWAFPSWNMDYQGVMKLCDLPSPCGPYGICNGNTNNNMDPEIACECPHPLVRKNESNAMQGCGISRMKDQEPNSSTGSCLVNDRKSQLYVGLEGVQILFHKDELINTSSGLSSKSRSVSECETECNSDCECVAYFYSNTSAIPCSFAYHSALAMQNSTNDGNMAFIKIVKIPSLSSLSASPITAIPSSFLKPSGRSHLVKIIMPIFSCLVALALVLVLASYCLHRRRRSGTTLEEQPVLRTPPS